MAVILLMMRVGDARARGARRRRPPRRMAYHAIEARGDASAAMLT